MKFQPKLTGVSSLFVQHTTFFESLNGISTQQATSEKSTNQSTLPTMWSRTILELSLDTC